MEIAIAFLLLSTVPALAQDANSCPMHKEHMQAAQHQTEIEKHGDQAMGFPHDKTTHRFRQLADGGAIEVTVNDANDTANLEAIRGHLKHITALFSEGDFSIPMFVHGEIPPGVPVMKEKPQPSPIVSRSYPQAGECSSRQATPKPCKPCMIFCAFRSRITTPETPRLFLIRSN
jgi:hypothetical protein